ncbi:hypothetical protein ACH4OW_38090, partial [Streptomyces sp. NPDC017056]
MEHSPPISPPPGGYKHVLACSPAHEPDTVRVEGPAAGTDREADRMHTVVERELELGLVLSPERSI